MALFLTYVASLAVVICTMLLAIPFFLKPTDTKKLVVAKSGIERTAVRRGGQSRELERPHASQLMGQKAATAAPINPAHADANGQQAESYPVAKKKVRTAKNTSKTKRRAVATRQGSDPLGYVSRTEAKAGPFFFFRN